MLERDYFDEIFPEDKIKHESVSSCIHDQIIADGHYTCIKCGEVDLYKPVFYETINKIYKSYFVYHRKSYFKDKLREIVGIKQSLSSKYHQIISILKKHNFDTIFELKKIMKKLHYSKYYKFIYDIFFTIKGIKLVSLSSNDINYLANKFIKFEIAFKKQIGKRNILSYNTIIYALLKQYKYPSYKHIILPKNNRRLLKVITNILESIEISETKIVRYNFSN